jgi:hypothetical protein
MRVIQDTPYFGVRYTPKTCCMAQLQITSLLGARQAGSGSQGKTKEGGAAAAVAAASVAVLRHRIAAAEAAAAEARAVGSGDPLQPPGR